MVENLYTNDEACKILKFPTIKAFNTWRCRNKTSGVSGFKAKGRKLLFTESEIQEWIDLQKAKGGLKR